MGLKDNKRLALYFIQKLTQLHAIPQHVCKSFIAVQYAGELTAASKALRIGIKSLLIHSECRRYTYLSQSTG
jgi:hypothetical protein